MCVCCTHCCIVVGRAVRQSISSHNCRGRNGQWLPQIVTDTKSAVQSPADETSSANIWSLCLSFKALMVHLCVYMSRARKSLAWHFDLIY